MDLAGHDSQLVQIMDQAFNTAATRAGSWLACRPGCSQCCHGAFAINALDILRLRGGMKELRVNQPALAEAIERRAQTWIATFGPDFPGDPRTGRLGESEADQERFEEFANDAACPALNPATGLCDIYAARPMTCRVFGPPVRMDEGDSLGCCELCFVGASQALITSCEMPIPHDLEAQLLAEAPDIGQSVVAFALLGTS